MYQSSSARVDEVTTEEGVDYRIDRSDLDGDQDAAVSFEKRSHTLAAVDAIPPAVTLKYRRITGNRAAGVQG